MRPGTAAQLPDIPTDASLKAQSDCHIAVGLEFDHMVR
jgi:hypothetical protein